MDKSKAIAIDTMSYLDDLSNQSAKFQLPDVLKTYYLTKCRVSEITSNINLSAKEIDPKERCPHCCVVYSENKAEYRIESAQKLSKFGKKCLKKQENEETLTKYQEKYVKRLKKDNFCSIKCGLCGLKTKIGLEKPEKVKEIVENVSLPVKKKKKKKDRYSGLNIQAPVKKETTIIKEKKKPSKITLAFSSNKMKKKLLNGTTKQNKNEKSENAKKIKMNKMEKLLKSKVNTPKNSLKNFLDSLT